MRPRAVLEIGGTHVTAASIDAAGCIVRENRQPLEAGAEAAVLVSVFAGAARGVVAEPADWVIAIPGPFDYERGIAHYGEGKFDALHDLDLRAALTTELGGTFSFINDADAFALGAWTSRKHLNRLVAITLGTGIGSGWISAGEIVTDSVEVPPGGAIHELTVAGRPLEDWVSRQAICQAYGPGFDVVEICSAARAGERRAAGVLDDAMTVLGHALAPWLRSFRADGLVIGGSIARSWDVLAPAFTAVIRTPAVEVVLDTEVTSMAGATYRLANANH